MKFRVATALVIVSAVLAAWGGLTTIGSAATPQPLDIRVKTSALRNLSDATPQGGTTTQFHVVLKNEGSNTAAIQLNADGGYDYASPNTSATCTKGGRTFGGRTSCNWSSLADESPTVAPGTTVGMTVRTGIEGLETQNPGTLFFQFCINANDLAGHTEHQCFVLDQPGVLTD